MSTTYMPATYGDSGRWHDPANDCPKKAAFLDQLLGRKSAAPPEHTPEEQRRCKLKACNKIIQEDVGSKKSKRVDVMYCSRNCAQRYRYALNGAKAAKASYARHAGHCRKCGTARPAGERCPKCQAETKRKSNAVQQAKHKDILAEAMALPADAELSPVHRHVLASEQPSL